LWILNLLPRLLLCCGNTLSMLRETTNNAGGLLWQCGNATPFKLLHLLLQSKLKFPWNIH
jgi:hypothetical protein